MEKHFIRFRKSEKIAIFLFTLLLFVFFLVYILLENYTATKWHVAYYGNDSLLSRSAQTSTHKPIPLPADPNIASLGQLTRIGISAEAGKSIIAYRNAGGVFTQPSDLKNITSLSPQEYEKALPFIHIAPPINKKPITTHTKRLLDINRMNKDDWQQIEGISTKDALRIIKFRNQLGGFFSIEQLKEVINFPANIFHRITKNLQCDTTRIASISMKSASLEQLKNHPYISDKMASALYHLSQTKANKDECISMLYKNLSGKDVKKVLRYLNFE